jgi:prevent-host-death family protein
MALKVIGTRQLRDELASVMDQVSEVAAIIVTHRGEGKAVMMAFDRYNELMDRLEFLEDSLDAQEASREGATPVDDLTFE